MIYVSFVFHIFCCVPGREHPLCRLAPRKQVAWMHWGQHSGSQCAGLGHKMPIPCSILSQLEADQCGLVAEDKIGETRFTHIRPDERDKGCTVKSSLTSVVLKKDHCDGLTHPLAFGLPATVPRMFDLIAQRQFVRKNTPVYKFGT